MLPPRGPTKNYQESDRSIPVESPEVYEISQLFDDLKTSSQPSQQEFDMPMQLGDTPIQQPSILASNR